MAAPPLTQSDAVTSLLSLSIAAASSSPVMSGSGQHPTPIPTKHHRRLGSTGKTRRRLSDAREACTRPLLASTTAALSLASLSLSASPPSTTNTSTTSTSFGGICKPLAPKPHSSSIHIISGSAPNPVHLSLSNGSNNFSLLASAATVAPPEAKSAADDSEQNDTNSTTPIPISNGKAGAKKRGIDYKCESCSKVYRHPNCLNKHRWEHTRQWREASKFVLSKHQQVQLLEAAAILSFMGKQPASLPEDRSEWPSFLSGGSLPKAEPVAAASIPSTSTSASSIPSLAGLSSSATGLSSATSASALSQLLTTNSSTTPTHPISSSVPNPQPSGPRLHDYALKASGGKVVVTQVRPGLLLGVNNGSADPSPPGTAYPMSMPVQQFTPTRVPHGYGYDYGYPPPPSTGPNGSENGIGNNNSPWSLPNSSMRSVSHGRSLSSLSGSVSAQSEDDGDVEIDIEDVDDEDEEYGIGRERGRRVLVRNGHSRAGMGMGIDVEDMGDDEEDDEHYHGHNNHEDDDNEEEDDDNQGTQTEIYRRYNASSRMKQQQQHPPSQMKSNTRWDRVGMDIDIEMDMDMD